MWSADSVRLPPAEYTAPGVAPLLPMRSEPPGTGVPVRPSATAIVKLLAVVG